MKASETLEVRIENGDTLSLKGSIREIFQATKALLDKGHTLTVRYFDATMNDFTCWQPLQ